MIMSICSLIAALKGGASMVSHCSRVWVMIGKAPWLSVAVSPWPGKCLTRGDATVALVAGDLGGGQLRGELGREEKDRVPMTGLRGLTLTSQSGAKFVLTPIASSSRPVMAAAVRASGALRPHRGPSTRGTAWPGPMRVTTPCSWSVAIWSGMRTLLCCVSAAFCRPLERPTIWSGFCTLSVHAK